MRRPALVVALLGAALVGGCVPAATPAGIAHAEASDRQPVVTGPLEWVAHADNPFRQGDDPDFINSDLAFTGDYVVQGNYDGFSMWDVSDPTAPTLASAVVCPGGQADVTAAGDLVFLSVDETMSSDRCDASRVPETAENWEGIRIFDVSDPRAPQYVAAVRTRCGSHTHTLVPDPADPGRVYLYVSAYSRGASRYCTGRNPVQIIAVDLDDPASASVATEIDFFDDANAFGPSDRAPGGAETRTTSGCHDLTAYPAKGLAVAACRGDGLLLSIADPLQPTVLQRLRDSEITFWHSGIFSVDADRVVFQDELGDGFINACTPEFGPSRGADSLWTMEGGTLVEQGYAKIDRPQAPEEKCVSHSGGLVPVPGRFVIVQAWLEGGVSLLDLTDPAAPVELASFDRPGYGYAMPYTAGIWAAYYSNGYVYASDMYEGLEVLRITDPAFADAARYTADSLNPQTQPAYDWVWRTAPSVPTDAAERSALPELGLAPAVVEPARAATPLGVAVPPGTFEPGETVDVWWMDEPRVLASFIADEEGALPADASVTPSSPLAAGRHDLAARGDRTAPSIALGTLLVEEPERSPAAPPPPPPASPSPLVVALLAGGGVAVLLAGVALSILLIRRRRRARA